MIGITAVAYAGVLVATRVGGRRTLSRLSAFDVVVTIALGTILGSIAVSDTVSVTEGLAAVVTLIALQIVLGLARTWSPRLRRIIDFRPVVVVEDGRPSLPTGPFGPQLTPDELESQLRLRGEPDPTGIDRAVLEPIGGVSVAGVPSEPLRSPGRMRSTDEVLQSHLARRKAGDLEGDLRENYATDVVLLSADGIDHGHDGVRRLAEVLRSYVSDGSYRYQRVLTEGDVGLLRWSAADADTHVHDGADSYVVRGGRIVAQTIHYPTDGTT